MTALLLVSCNSGEKGKTRGDLEEEVREETSPLLVYYLNRNDSAVKGVEFEGGSDVESLLGRMRQMPDDADLKITLGSEVDILSNSLLDGRLIIDFNEDYRKLPKAREVLFRAAVVRTLCQAKGVETVNFLCQGENLLDSKDIPYGAMKADDFVYSGRDETGSYVKAELTLYFADSEGGSLVVEKQNVVYSPNVAIEKIIVEHLIAGPVEEGHRATLASDRIVKSVSVKDGICYLDLTDPLVDLTGAVDEEVSLYSIVNSLTEMTYINKVRISIDGETDRTFRGGIRLDEMFERNLDLIKE